MEKATFTVTKEGQLNAIESKQKIEWPAYLLYDLTRKQYK